MQIISKTKYEAFPASLFVFAKNLYHTLCSDIQTEKKKKKEKDLGLYLCVRLLLATYPYKQLI